MRTIRGRSGWLLVALLAVAGCGGGVSGIGTKGGDGGPGNPGDDAIAPSEDGGSIDPRCVQGGFIGTGVACGFSGLTCPLGTVSDCNGGQRTLECSCDGETWSCDPVTRVDCSPPPSACPDPSNLYPGSPCAGPTGQQCVSTDIPSDNCGQELMVPIKGICTCTNGGWSCPVAHPDCQPPPVQACPSPYGVYSGNYCDSPGLSCPGDPQNCGDQVYYDALQCQGSTWVSVATTICEIADDGGESFDAPIFFDSATADGS
jgi:hypothetical protein